MKEKVAVRFARGGGGGGGRGVSFSVFQFLNQSSIAY